MGIKTWRGVAGIEMGALWIWIGRRYGLRVCVLDDFLQVVIDAFYGMSCAERRDFLFP